MTRRIVITLLVAALAAAVVYGIVHGYELWRAAKVAEGDAAGYGRCDRERKQERIEQAAETSRLVAQARKDEQDMAAAAAQGEADARQQAEAQAQRQAAAARRAASAAGSVREQLAALDAAAAAAGVPDAAACPAAFARQRDDAVRARAVFGACVSRYSLLAERAGRDRLDLQLRLATALSYIRATGAPGADQIPPSLTP